MRASLRNVYWHSYSSFVRISQELSFSYMRTHSVGAHWLDYRAAESKPHKDKHNSSQSDNCQRRSAQEPPTMMLLIGMKTNFTAHPIKPMIAKPIAHATAIFPM